jgi:hypothetical protein
LIRESGDLVIGESGDRGIGKSKIWDRLGCFR